MDIVRITELQPKTYVEQGDYIAIDNQSDGTKKVQFTNLLDDTLSQENKIAPANVVGDEIATIRAAVGSPLKASTVAQMTDTNKIYVYVGSESGYTNGNWYYWNGSAWTSGGVYNSVAVVTDPTLTLSGVPADAKATGDEITDLKNELMQIADGKNITPITTETDTYATVSGGSVREYALTNCNCAKYDISDYVGTTIKITTQRVSGNTYKVFYVVTDDNGTSLELFQDASTSISDYPVTLGETAKYLYVNYVSTSTPSVFALENMRNLEGKINNIINDVYYDMITDIVPTNTYEGFYVAINTDNNKVKSEAVSGCAYSLYSVSAYAGKNVRFSSQLLSASYPNAVLVTNSSGNIIQTIKNESVTEYTNYEFTLASTASLMYVNYVPDSLELHIINPYNITDVVNNLIDKGDVNHRIRGKKCVCFGDSITWYDGHVYNWGKEQGETAKGYETYMRNAGMLVNNQGYSGAAINDIVDTKVKAFDYTDYDYVTLTSGANDSRYQIPVGEIADIGSTFDNTFIGKLQEGIEYILGENPEIKILLITPIRGWIYAPDGYASNPKPTEDGVVEEKYADAIKAVAEFYSLPVCDWYNDCGLNLLTRNWYINDPEPDKEATPNPNILYSLHPSTKGYKRMADLLLPAIRSI